MSRNGNVTVRGAGTEKYVLNVDALCSKALQLMEKKLAQSRYASNGELMEALACVPFAITHTAADVIMR